MGSAYGGSRLRGASEITCLFRVYLIGFRNPFTESMPLKKDVKKPAEGAPSTPAPTKKSAQPIALLRGMRDLLPQDLPYLRMIEATVARVASAYGFQEIETPLVEETALFARGVGKATDIVEKEMYTWETPGGESVSLRPEGTASVVRAFIQHGMLNQPQPVKLWSKGPMFRYERPQAGRFRQFYQASLECIGDADPMVDAQLILIAHVVAKELGIDSIVRINSIGTPEARANYKNALVSYFRSKRSKLSEDDKKRLLKNPLRLLDSKDPGMQELKAEAPQMVDWLDEESRLHFTRVIEYLDEVGVPYELDPYLVRGLDYYTKTVFELYATSDDQELAQSAICGGGRYDGLTELLGGRPTPAAGLAFGLDRLLSRVRDQHRDQVPNHPKVDVFLAQLGDMGRKRALAIFEEFRQAGIRVGEALTKSSIKAQMEMANKQGAKWAIVIGQKEVLDGTAIIRDMDAGTQEIVDARKLVHEIRKKLGA